MLTSPLLTTPRLQLRPLKESDAEGIFALRSSAAVNKYIDRPSQTKPEEASAFITKISGLTAEGKSCYWALTEKEKDALIGTACIWNLSADGQTAELGYEMNPTHQGKGLMTEAVKAVIDFAFSQTELQTLEAWTHKDNQASSQLLLKLGFMQEQGRKDPESENLLIFVLEKG